MSKKVLNISLLIIVAATILGLVFVWASFGIKPNNADAPKLSQRPEGQIRLEGSLMNEKNADLGFVISGAIVQINKRVGDSVRKGDVLAVESSDDIKAQVGAAKAQLAVAQAKLEGANHDLKKEKLKVKDVDGNAKKEQKAQVSSSEDDVTAQEHAVKAASESLAAAEATFAKTILRAPFDGVVTRQDGEVGEIAGVAAQSFMTIASNEQPSKIEVYASDLDASIIQVGQKAHVSFDILGQQNVLQATVTAIDPQADIKKNAAFKITLHLEQSADNLKAGMHAIATF